ENVGALAHRYRDCVLERIAIGAAADGGKCDALQAVLDGERKARAVARGEQLRLAVPAAMPYRSHGMDYVLCRQPVALRDAGLPGRASAQGPAFFEQLRAGRAVDRPVHAAAAEQGRVRGVDDGVERQRHDIDLSRFKSLAHIVSRVSGLKLGLRAGPQLET